MADPIAAESASVNSTSSYQTETVRAAKPDIKQTEVIYSLIKILETDVYPSLDSVDKIKLLIYLC